MSRDERKHLSMLMSIPFVDTLDSNLEEWGYSSRSEFMKEAVRNKFRRHKEDYVDPYPVTELEDEGE